MPQEAVVESGVSAEQSSLRDVCRVYIERASAEGWVTPSSGLLGIAKVLIDGADADAPKRETYADRMAEDTSAPAALFARIASDIDAANDGLNVVVQHAAALIEAPGLDRNALRRDVMAFERALVSAQKSRSSFEKAMARVAERGEAGLEPTRDKLARFDLSIARARSTADSLSVASVQHAEPRAVS